MMASQLPSVMGVDPGAMAFTLMPNSAYSAASVLVMIFAAFFAAGKAHCILRGTVLFTEVVLMMHPLRFSSMYGMTALQQRIRP